MTEQQKELENRRNRKYMFSGQHFEYKPEINELGYLKTLTDEERKETLIKNNMALVLNICRAYYKYDHYEDLLMNGTVGLVKAANTFDTEKENSFATYAIRCIRNEINMLFRKINKFENNEVHFSYVSKNNDTYGEEYDFTELVGYDDKRFDEYEEKQFANHLRDVVNNLKEKERKIVELRIYQNLSQDETAATLGYSQSYVSRLERQIYKKLKGMMNL